MAGIPAGAGRSACCRCSPIARVAAGRPGLLIVPSKAFTADVEGVAVRIVRHLGGKAHLEGADRAKLGQLQSAADRLRDRRRELLRNEEELLAALEIDALNALFARETPFPFSAIEDDVRRWRQSLSGRWGEASSTLLPAMTTRRRSGFS